MVKILKHLISYNNNDKMKKNKLMYKTTHFSSCGTIIVSCVGVGVGVREAVTTKR